MNLSYRLSPLSSSSMQLMLETWGIFSPLDVPFAMPPKLNKFLLSGQSKFVFTCISVGENDQCVSFIHPFDIENTSTRRCLKILNENRLKKSILRDCSKCIGNIFRAECRWKIRNFNNMCKIRFFHLNIIDRPI